MVAVDVGNGGLEDASRQDVCVDFAVGCSGGHQCWTTPPVIAVAIVIEAVAAEEGNAGGTAPQAATTIDVAVVPSCGFLC